MATDTIKTVAEVFAEMQADFLDRETILRAPRVIYRWREGERRYFTVGPDGSINWYLSTTTAWKYALPKSEFLIQWMATYPGGYRAAMEYRDQRADYGTLLHILISRFLTTGEIDLDRIPETIAQHKKDEGLRWNTDDWARQAKKDLLAFAQFASDYRLDPVAIEIVLGSDALATAGAVDIVCRLTVSRAAYEKNGALKPYVAPEPEPEPESGKKKRKSKKAADEPLKILALGDWKSSLSGFFPEADYQVGTNNLLWVANFPDPDLRPAALFLWRPKDWRTGPTYELRNATDAVPDADARLGLRWARRRATIKPRPVKEFCGALKLGTAPGAGEFRDIDADDYVYDTIIRPKLERVQEMALYAFADDGGPCE